MSFKTYGTPENLPFTPAIEANGFVFLSGQGGFDANGGLPASIEEQTENTLKNIQALLAEAGCALGDVVSCLVHLADLSHFGRFNAVYARAFGDPRPVRTTVGAHLVRGMLVEITVVARKP